MVMQYLSSHVILLFSFRQNSDIHINLKRKLNFREVKKVMKMRINSMLRT